MRGIVSLAAALGLPLALENGQPFPERDLIVFLTFSVIAVTLVLQGLTLAPLIRVLDMGHDPSADGERQVARVALAAAAAAAIDAAAQDPSRAAYVPGELVERIRAEFSEKAVFDTEGAADSRVAQLASQLRRAALAAERRELIRIWRADLISDEVLHELEEVLDYRESHA